MSVVLSIPSSSGPKKRLSNKDMGETLASLPLESALIRGRRISDNTFGGKMRGENNTAKGERERERERELNYNLTDWHGTLYRADEVDGPQEMERN